MYTDTIIFINEYCLILNNNTFQPHTPHINANPTNTGQRRTRP